MTGIIELLKQVGIFMVCAQTIIHFKPQQKYDKYLKLLVGIMVIAQLLQPVLNIFGGNTMKEQVIEFVSPQSIQEETEFDVDKALGDADEILNKYADSEVKSRLNKENYTDNTGEKSSQGATKNESDISSETDVNDEIDIRVDIEEIRRVE